MNKVCHITSAHPWADIRIFKKQCVSLANSGFDTYLIAFDAPNEKIEGVNIVSAGEKPFSRKERFIHSPSLIYSFAAKIDAEIYHLHDPELLPLGLKLSRLGKKVIYDAHEDLPRQILDKPYLNKYFAKILSLFIEKYENYCAKKFAAIVTATPFIKTRFLKINKKTTDINNFPLNSEIDLGEDNNIEKENRICYIGAISEIRGLTQLVKSLNFCENIKLDLAGDCYEEEYLSRLKTLAEWSKVNYLGHINREQSLKIKSLAFAGLITFLPAANHINAQPNKIFEYMASGLPVICSNFPMWKLLIEQNNCGICVNPQKPEEIANAINKLSKDPILAKKMGENGKKAVVEKYNWQMEEKKLLQLYNELLNNV